MIGAGRITERELRNMLDYKIVQLTPTQELNKLLKNLKQRKQSLVEQNQRCEQYIVDNKTQIAELDKAIDRIKA